VRSDLGRTAKLLVLPTAGLFSVVAFVPGRTELAVRIYALVLCGAALLLLLGALRRAYEPATRVRARTRRNRPAGRHTPGSLARIEQEVALGIAGAFDLHHRLRPRLRTLASELLATRRGISLTGAPERAREVLGAATWELVREDRLPPEDRQARGMPINELTGVVESFERH
jgi:hypothetical protein